MTQAQAPTNKKPSEHLADEIVSALQDAGLVLDSDLAKLQEGLSTGTFSQDDWLALARHAVATSEGKQ